MSKIKFIICENQECRLNNEKECINNINSERNKKLTAKQRKSKSTLTVELEPNNLGGGRVYSCMLYLPTELTKE